jgi:WXG100 family type VII secretion target
MQGHVSVDTALMQQTALQSKNIADNMVTQATTLKAGLAYVLEKWKGQAGDAFRQSMGTQSQVLDRLIQRLQEVSDLVNRGGQGLDAQDATAKSNLTTQGQNFLNASLNH